MRALLQKIWPSVGIVNDQKHYWVKLPQALESSCKHVTQTSVWVVRSLTVCLFAAVQSLRLTKQNSLINYVFFSLFLETPSAADICSTDKKTKTLNTIYLECVKSEYFIAPRKRITGQIWWTGGDIYLFEWVWNERSCHSLLASTPLGKELRPRAV